MRLFLIKASLFFAALYRVSSVTPDPQDCQIVPGSLTFIDDDDIALCSGSTVMCEACLRTEPLPLSEHAGHVSSPFISKSTCRAPPIEPFSPTPLPHS